MSSRATCPAAARTGQARLDRLQVQIQRLRETRLGRLVRAPEACSLLYASTRSTSSSSRPVPLRCGASLVSTGKNVHVAPNSGDMFAMVALVR